MKLERLAAVFKALSEETRLMILSLLEKKPLCVCEIMGALNITQTKASRHLIYLKNAGLLTSKKEDRWVLYMIREDLPQGVKEIVKRAAVLARESEGFPDVEARLERILKHESIYRQVHGVVGGGAKASRTACGI